MTMNKKLLTSALAFVCLLVAQSGAQQLNQQQVRHLIINEANLIETSQGYAITAPALTQNNWKTVTVNGDQVQVTAPNCQQNTMSKQDLMSNPAEQNLLMSARQMLYSAESSQPQMPQMQIYRSGSARYSLGGTQQATMSFGRNIGMSSFQSNGLSMTKYDDHNMSIAKSNGLSNNINRVFITGDAVTFVFIDGRLEMKPQNCLNQDEQQLVQQLKSDVQQTQQQFQINMQQFQHNMQQMNRRLRGNMHQMHQNINNMFQQTFPFNNGHMLQQQNMLNNRVNPVMQQQQVNSFPGGFMPPMPLMPSMPMMPQTPRAISSFENSAFAQGNGFGAMGPMYAQPFWPSIS